MESVTAIAWYLRGIKQIVLQMRNGYDWKDVGEHGTTNNPWSLRVRAGIALAFPMGAFVSSF